MTGSHSKRSLGTKKETQNGRTENQNPFEGLRLSRAGYFDRRDRRYREAHRSPGCRAHSAADHEEQVLRAAFPARGQEIARGVRDSHAQTADRYSRADPADGGRADEARPAGGGRRRDQDGTEVARQQVSESAR